MQNSLESVVNIVIDTFKEDKRSIKEIAERTGIQATRVHRLKKGWPVKMHEWVSLANDQGMTLERAFELILNKDLGNELTKKKAEIDALKLDMALKIVGDNFKMTPELLVWKIGGYKNENA